MKDKTIIIFVSKNNVLKVYTSKRDNQLNKLCSFLHKTPKAIKRLRIDIFNYKVSKAAKEASIGLKSAHKFNDQWEKNQPS